MQGEGKMFHAELVATTVLDPKFHGYSEQITGSNSASVVQNNKRPKSDLAYILAYFKAFNDPHSDTSDVGPLLGLMHFILLCGGPELDMADVTSSQHGLRCFAAETNGRGGPVGILFAGDGEQWKTALRNAGSGTWQIQEWGKSCHQQFAMHNLDDLMGKLRPSENQYFLENS